MQLNVSSFSIGKLSENRFTRPVKRTIVRSAASSRGPRTILNGWYGLLDDRARARFHRRYSKLFRDEKATPLVPGYWTVRFMDREIRLPLRPAWSWLDWDAAVSILGNDIEVKQTYAALIKSQERPEVFLDVGASYGTHSVLFLSAGIPAISFEPNSNCFSYFKDACELNGLKGRWEQVAIGDQVGHIDLAYPKNDTWLGSVSSDVTSTLKKTRNVLTERASLKTLDDYSHEISGNRILVKIDVEGFEVEVLQGASRILRDFEAKIIFESNDGKARRRLFQLLGDYGYSIHSLPWRPTSAVAALQAEEFERSADTNFIAVAR